MKTLSVSFHEVKSHSPNFLFANKVSPPAYYLRAGILIILINTNCSPQFLGMMANVQLPARYVWWRVSFAQRGRKSFSHWGETVRERAFFILRMFHSRQPHSMHHHRTEGHRLFMARMNAYTFCSSSRVSFRPNFFPSFNPSEKSTCIVCP